MVDKQVTLKFSGEDNGLKGSTAAVIAELKKLRDESEKSGSALDRALITDKTRIRRQQLAGVLSARQAQEQITNALIKGSQDRIAALKKELEQVKNLREQAGDDEALIARETGIAGALGTAELGLVEQQLSAQEQAAARTQKSLQSIAVLGGAAGAAIGGLFTAGTQEFIRLDAALSSFSAKSGIAKEDLEGLADESLRVASVTSQTPATVAELATSLLALGASSEQAQGNLEAIAQLSDAVGGNLVETGQVLQTGLNIFEDTGETADLLADKINKLINTTSAGSSGGVGEFFQLFSEAAPVAKTAGVSFDDLAASFSTLRDNGTPASVASTALKNALISLAAPTDKATGQLDKLGISFDQFTDAQGNLNFEGLLVGLSESLSGIDDNAERIAILSDIFGREAAPAIATLTQNVIGANGEMGRLQQTLGELANAGGSTAESLETINQGLGAQITLLEGAASGVLTRFGEVGSEALAPLVGIAANVLKAFLELPAPMQRALVATTGFVGILGAASAAVIAFQIANKQLEIVQTAVLLKTKALTVAKGAYALATGGATAAQKQFAASLGASALKAGLAAAAIAALALNFQTFREVTKYTREAEKSVESIDKALLELKKASADAAETPEEVAEATQSVIESNREAVEDSINTIDKFFDKLRGGIGLTTASDAALNNQAVGFSEVIEGVDSALNAFDEFNAQGIENASEEELEAMVSVIDTAIARIQELTPATEIQAASQRVYAKSLEAARDKLKGTTEGQEGLSEALEDGAIATTEAAESTEDALKRIESASDEATGAIEASVDSQIQAIKQQQLEGVISAEEAQAAITAVQVKGGDDRIAALQDELDQIRILRQGEDSDDLRSREAQIVKEIGDIQTQNLDQQIAAQEHLQQAEQERIEHLQQAEQERIEHLQQAEQERIEEAKQTRLDAIKEQSQAADNLAREQQQALEQRIRSEERITQAIDNQNRLIQARRGLIDAITSLQQSEFSIAARLTDDAEEKARIEAEATNARLEALRTSQAIERQIFELGVQRQQTELQIEAIRLRAAAAQNEAEQARAEAAIEQARVEGASDAEIRARQLDLNAARIAGDAIAQQQGGLSQQATLLSLTTELERNTLAIQQQEQRQQARADVVESGVAAETARLEERRTEENGDRIDAQIQQLRDSAFEGLRDELLNSARTTQAPQFQQLARDIFPVQSVVQPFQAQPQARQVAAPEKQASQFGDVTINQTNTVDVRGQSPGAVQQDFEQVALNTFDQVATKLQELTDQ